MCFSCPVFLTRNIGIVNMHEISTSTENLLKVVDFLFFVIKMDIPVHSSHRFNTFLRKLSTRTYTRKIEPHNLKHSININTWMEAQRIRNEGILSW